MQLSGCVAISGDAKGSICMGWLPPVVWVGVAADCARWRLVAPSSASTKCFLLLIIPKRRDCARSEVRPSPT